MNRTSSFRKIVSGTLIFLMLQVNAYAASTDIATAPLVTSPQSSVLPNLMFILDDSGSMDSDYVPDWANSSNNALFRNVDYNGTAYDPSVTYAAPTYYNSDGSLNTTSYPNMSGTNTQGSCGAAYCAVKNDGYGIQDTGTSDLRSVANFYTFIAGEYCTTANLRTCSAQTAASVSNPFPAVVRWCTTSGNATAATPAAGTCQASRIENGTTYMNARYAGMVKPTAALVVTVASTTATTTSIKINGLEILSATTAASTNSNATTRANNQGSAIRAAINACTSSITGNCQVAGYSASGSNANVTISAPTILGTIAAFVPYTPVVTSTATVTSAAFVSGTPGGHNLRTDIVSTTTSYPYPGTATKATSRTDCAGTTCTFTEEMNNYANWWAYYRTRMQMMKTAVSTAFKPVDSKYRVGFMSINGNVSGNFLNISTFDNTQKLAWYNRFFASVPNNSTPLRQALSVAGRIFAGKKNGTTQNGTTVIDPMQYSCQQNFTLLTTDGYWNGNAGFQLDGSTAIGNQDGIEPRPFNDGANLIVSTVTPTVTTVRKQTVQGVQSTIPWARTNTTIGTTCSIPAGTVPSSCVQDNGNNSANAVRTWCMVTSTGGSNQFSGPIGAGNIYAGRGVSNTTNPPTSGSPSACKTDATGQWCVYNSSNPAGATNCVQALSGDNIYVCQPTAAISGKNVTVTNQSYNQIQAGATTTSIDDTATTTYSTVVSTNGVPAPSQPNTPSQTVATTNISLTTPTYTTDNGVPTGGTTWTNGSSVGPTCVATASLPATGGSVPTSGTPAQSNVGSAAVSTVSTAGPTVGTPFVSSTSSTGGTSDTLADVAEYYYLTDLRTSALSNCTGAVVSPATTGFDVCSNDVAGSGLDAASWQHMTTFTLGLANGNMQYSPTYQTQLSGDFFDVKNGTVANAAAGVCGWQSSGSCNWPVPASDSQNNIDDLWHAAVNGRGQYFSATSPGALAAGLNSALAGVNARSGSSAAATTSNPNVTSGDNFVFSSTFTTNEWDGELVRQQLDLVTGAVSSTIDWTAQAQLDLLAYGSRNIFKFDTSNSTSTNTNLKTFTYANLTAAQQAYFTTPNIAGLSQFCASGVTCLASSDQTAASGSPLVNFLRGDRSNEGISSDTTKYFRARVHVLGDVVNAEAVYVKTPLLSYVDPGYSAYVAAQASRLGMVYVASNDGMMHAFNATTGAENFTFVPSLVMPNLYKLADKNYTAQHRYFVDGTPVAGDAYFSGAWHTIVVGGLNSGGNGYYALDVTDPANPKALWEFTDTNMGNTFGNPIISKLQDGTWVVFLTSGYNNNGAGQDGVGRLYVLNAGTGALIRTISTGAGSVATPSGLGKINAWVDNTSADNTTLRVYGGDLLGNVWRFDVNNIYGAAGYDAQKLVQLYANGGPTAAGTVTQPITTKPELGDVSGVAVIYVGTGKYLGLTDLTDTTQQTFYAIKDALDATTLGNPRITTSKFVQQVATNTTCPSGTPTTICSTGQKVRTSTANTVTFTNNTNNGWFIDLPDSGERANTDPTLALGTLGFTTNIPNTSACTAGGNSFRWLLDYRSGAPVTTSTTGVSSVSLGNALATRAVFVRLPNNTVVQLTRMSDGTTVTTNVPIGASAAGTRRVSWRELIQDQ
jgi:type IV pilus assembly protein PilY1